MIMLSFTSNLKFGRPIVQLPVAHFHLDIWLLYFNLTEMELIICH